MSLLFAALVHTHACTPLSSDEFMKVTQEACPEVRVAFRPPGIQVRTFIDGCHAFSQAKAASLNWDCGSGSQATYI